MQGTEGQKAVQCPAWSQHNDISVAWKAPPAVPMDPDTRESREQRSGKRRNSQDAEGASSGN